MCNDTKDSAMGRTSFKLILRNGFYEKKALLAMSSLKTASCSRIDLQPVIIICFLARVIATLSLRSIMWPSSSKQLAVRKSS